MLSGVGWQIKLPEMKRQRIPYTFHVLLYLLFILILCIFDKNEKFEDLHKLKLLTNFDVNLIPFLGWATNYVLNVEFISFSRDNGKLTSKFVRRFSLWRSLKWSEEFSLNGVEVIAFYIILSRGVLKRFITG